MPGLYRLGEWPPRESHEGGKYCTTKLTQAAVQCCIIFYAAYTRAWGADVTSLYLQVGDIFVLDYVPWGNAVLEKDGTIECQHGKLECTLNTVEACALHYYPNE